MTAKELGQCLKEVRLQHGLSQFEIAEKLGIPKNTYGNYERGVRDPNIETITKFCEIFGITVGELLKEKNPWEQMSENMQRLLKKLLRSSVRTQEEAERYVDFCEDGEKQKTSGKNGA